jgi:hypothetical protein
MLNGISAKRYCLMIILRDFPKLGNKSEIANSLTSNATFNQQARSLACELHSNREPHHAQGGLASPPYA